MGFLALSPLLFFVAVYLVTSIIIGDFYKIPITVAFMASSIYAVVVSGGPLQRRIELFSRGASNSKMMLMIWIFLLAGAFAQSAKSMGSIDATVDITLSILPSNMILAGLFLASCFISLSIGTSVGTIVALAPIAVGISDSTGLNTSMLTAIVVGGSFFGDNMSFISDTTIAATSTQGCKLSDKFKVNAFLAIPAAVFILVVYLIYGQSVSSDYAPKDINYIKIIPYIIVLITAIIGVNVMVVLTIGLLLTGIIGISLGSFDVFGWMKSMSDGMLGMGELIIITMMAGGMLELIKHNGGIDYLINNICRKINGKRGAETSIAILIGLVNVCTANNTVAIITVGSIAKKISDKYSLDARKVASILDTMSCCVQGMIPYGAQVLIAAGLASVSPVSIIPYLYYPMCIGLFTFLAILFRYPRRYSSP